jgi:hypothetical protein
VNQADVAGDCGEQREIATALERIRGGFQS